MKNRLFRVFSFVAFLSVMALGVPKVALNAELALNGTSIRFDLPSDWEEVRMRFPREKDRPAISELLIAYPPTGGEVPTIYARVDLKPFNALESLSLIENMLDELRSLQKEKGEPLLLMDCSGTPPSSDPVYRFEEQLQLQDGSTTKVSVSQDACGVQARARIDLGGGKTLELGMVSPVENFEAFYTQDFLPVIASVRFEP